MIEPNFCSKLPPPLREGLMQIQPPRLVGSLCPSCKTRVFPPRDFCPACDSEDAPIPVVLAPVGTVHSYTIVRQAPGGRVVPYTLGLVDLEDGVRVFAQLDETPESIDIGMQVQLIFRNIVPSPGEPRLGYAFEALHSTKEALT